MSPAAPPPRPFYVTGGTLKPGEPSYVERAADGELLAALLAGELCYVLTPRQLGKSSLMARTAARLRQAGVRSAIVDLTQIGSERDAQASAPWYFGIASEIHRHLAIDTPLRPWWQERADLPPLQRLTGFFRELVLGRSTDRIVIFVDEIDSTLGLPFADDFFAALRACFNARATEPDFERLTFALLGVATPDELIQDPTRTPFNVGRRIELTDFTAAEAGILAAGLDDDDAEAGRRLARVLFWTAGHPYLTQALCRAVRDAVPHPAAGHSDQAIDRLVQDLFLSARAQREESNIKLTRARLERPGAEGRRLLSLYRRIRRGKPVADQATSPLVAKLKLTGVVKATADARLAVRNRVYELVFTAAWATTAMPADRARQVAVAAVAAATLGAFTWYAAFQPRPYERAFAAAIADDGYQGAKSAYAALRANPFSRSRATALMQRFWEQRGLRYALTGARDESLLCYLEGLQFGESERLRRLAQNLVGTDYAVLEQTQRLRASEASDSEDRPVLSPDGKTVAMPAAGGYILWDVDRGRIVARLKAYRGVFSHDGRTFAGIAEDWRLLASDTRGGEVRTMARLPHLEVMSFALSSDGHSFAVVLPYMVQVWEMGWPTPRWKARLLPPEGYGEVVAFSPDGKAVATGTTAGIVRLWDAQSGKPLTPRLGQGDSGVQDVAFSPDGRTVVAISGDDVQRWDAHNGQAVTPSLESPEFARVAAFSPDGRTFAAASDSTVQLWDVATGTALRPRLRATGGTSAIAFTPGSRALATVSSDGRVLRLWRVNGKERLPVSAEKEPQELHLPVAFSPDGRVVASGSADGAAKLWDARSGQLVVPPLRQAGRLVDVAFGRTGHLLITESMDHTWRLWDPHTGRPASAPYRTDNPFLGLSPATYTLAFEGDKPGAVRFLNLQTGQSFEVFLHRRRASDPIWFSPDGRLACIVNGRNDTLLLVDAKNGRVLSSLAGRTFPFFSPDGSTLATSSIKDGVDLWRVTTGASLGHLPAADFSYDVAFTDNGSAIATASGRFAELWDPHSGRRLASASVQAHPMWMDFLKHGKALRIITTNWFNLYTQRGAKLVAQSSQLLHGEATASSPSDGSCEECARLALIDAGMNFHLETVDPSAPPSDPPIAGSPDALLNRWQKILAMHFEPAEMRPVPGLLEGQQ